MADLTGHASHRPLARPIAILTCANTATLPIRTRGRAEGYRGAITRYSAGAAQLSERGANYLSITQFTYPSHSLLIHHTVYLSITLFTYPSHCLLVREPGQPWLGLTAVSI